MIWIYISIYAAITIATFIARMDYSSEYKETDFTDQTMVCILYAILWPIGFLSTLLYKFFVWLR